LKFQFYRAGFTFESVEKIIIKLTYEALFFDYRKSVLDLPED